MAATLIGLSSLTSPAQTDEEVNALVAEALSLPEWQTIVSATTGTGYKDNVFLAHADPRGSPFVSLAGELMWLRTGETGPRFNLFANVEARNFFGSGFSHQEYTAFSQAQLEYDFNQRLQGSIAAHYYYQDQLLNVAFLELTPNQTNEQTTVVRAAPVLGHTLGLQPGVRLQLAGLNWVALETPVNRQFFERPLDDYWDAGFRLTLGHNYGWESKVSLSYEPSWWFYDSDPALTATGEVIPDSLRRRFQHNVRLAWQHHLDNKKRWTTVAGVGARLNRENGGGFYDYHKWFASGRIQYRAHGWEISAEGRFAFYDYLNQTVSETDPTLRWRTEWTALLEAERRITDKVSVVASFEHEASGSNDPLETYSVNTISASVRWEF